MFICSIVASAPVSRSSTVARSVGSGIRSIRLDSNALRLRPTHISRCGFQKPADADIREGSMRAKDVMTTNVATLTPDMTVRDAAALFLSRRISGAPVVDAGGEVVGMLSEGDLLHRVETGTVKRRSWWLQLFTGPDQEAMDFIKSHASRVKDVMTSPAISVTEDAPLADVADLLEHRRIRRVPVVRDGRLVGIVSRADLLRGIAAAGAGREDVVSPDDESLRARIEKEFQSHSWAAGATVNVIVKDGVAHLWGMVHTDAERRALGAAAEGVPGVRRVENKVSLLPASYGAA